MDSAAELVCFLQQSLQFATDGVDTPQLVNATHFGKSSQRALTIASGEFLQVTTHSAAIGTSRVLIVVFVLLVVVLFGLSGCCGLFAGRCGCKWSQFVGALSVVLTLPMAMGY